MSVCRSVSWSQNFQPKMISGLVKSYSHVFIRELATSRGPHVHQLVGPKKFNQKSCLGKS